MNADDACNIFGSLSNPTRLSVLRRLIAAGADGLAAGRLSSQLEITPPTLSFHLKEMHATSLIISKRRGRSIVYSANFDRVRALLGFILEDCCAGNPNLCMPDQMLQGVNEKTGDLR